MDESTGPTGPVAPDPMELSPPVPRTISLAEILAEAEVTKQKEQLDKALLDSILSVSVLDVKPKLIDWALKGYPNSYSIYEVTVVPPPLCSDGVQRNFMRYVEYLLQKTLYDHMMLLQPRFIDITLVYVIYENTIQIGVVKG
jgi:hypothetical protein